jgi:hypothetical protein
MVNVQAAPDPFARASGKRGLGLALLLVTAPAPALAPAESLDQKRRDGTIQAALDYVAAHAVALMPTVVALLDARLIGERIFLYILLADREGASRSCGNASPLAPATRRGRRKGEGDAALENPVKEEGGDDNEEICDHVAGNGPAGCVLGLCGASLRVRHSPAGLHVRRWLVRRGHQHLRDAGAVVGDVR